MHDLNIDDILCIVCLSFSIKIQTHYDFLTKQTVLFYFSVSIDVDNFDWLV